MLVENAASFRHDDYDLLTMREEVLAGRRVLDNGTYVELQPGAAAKTSGIRWFAAIVDGRVARDGQITVQWCEDDCQKLTANHIARVHIESIIRVSAGQGRPFEDVPLSNVAATSAPHTDVTNQTRPSSTPPKRTHLDTAQAGASAQIRVQSATPKSSSVAQMDASSAGKRPRQSPLQRTTAAGDINVSANTPSVNPAKKVDSASSAETNPHHKPGSIHERETHNIVASIEKDTKRDAKSLKQFQDANKLLEHAGWSRCRTAEKGMASCPNIMHPSYSLKHMPRDGHCMYHCLLDILKAERVRGAPKDEKELRKQLARFVENQVPPEGEDKGEYGGLYTSDSVYIPLEESLLTSYGGESTLAVFVLLYGITLHCHAPECSSSVRIHQGDEQDANEYHLLQTLSWKAWTVIEKTDPITKKKTISYERNYIGDHWQLLEPASKKLQCAEVSQTKGNPASAVSAAATAHNYAGDHCEVLKPRSNTGPSKRLQFEPEPASSAASAAATVPRTMRSNIAPMKLQFSAIATSSAVSAAATAPKQEPQSRRVEALAPQQLKFGDPVQSATPIRHAAASPSFTLGGFATGDIYPASVHFMLREVSGRKTFVRNPIPAPWSLMHNRLRMCTVTDMHFLEDYFGETFRIVYPSSVQQLLYAFPELDESNRSFFMSLGIGADLDPYTLQHTFRSHALRLPKDSREVDQSIIQTLKPGFEVNWRVLQWCWPPALDAFRIHVLDSNQMYVLESPGTHNKLDMILRFHDHRYTLLHAIEGATAEGLMRRVPCHHLRLSHGTNHKLQCLDMRTFDAFFDQKCFVSAALQGSEPSEDELNMMWKEATVAAELEYDDHSQKWITLPAGLPPPTLGNTDGSLHTTSWKQLQQKLLGALESDAVSALKSDAASCEAPYRQKNLQSPPRSASANSGCANSGDVTFMDAGSEGGKGMYRMMSDKRIKHVAGVELQQAWYDASCKIMAHLREVFKAKNYRMPAVTIVRSCMVADIPELTYLYSITNLAWMNNFVFNKVQYFAATRTNKSAPQPLLHGCRDLTTNAALRFSRAFSGVTYIAVHNTDGFLPKWNYTCFKPFKARVTWGETECNVTIIRHLNPQQHEITEEDMGQKTHYALPIPNREELQLWDDNLKKWSQLIPTLYKVISEESFITDRLRGEQANDARLDQERRVEKTTNKKTKVIHTSSDDEPVKEWCFDDAIAKSSAAHLTQVMPSATNADWTTLVRLTDSNWLSCDILVPYKELLKQQFPGILFIDLKANIKRQLQSRPVLVGYMNLNDNHWIAAKLDLTQNLAAIADSLHETYKHEHRAVFERLQSMATLAGHQQQLRCFTVDVPNQRNTNDCGVFACLFQLYMAQTVTA